MPEADLARRAVDVHRLEGAHALGEFGGNHLHHDRAPQRVFVRHEHARHAAAAELALDIDFSGALTQEFRAQAIALRQLADLKDQGIHIAAAKESAAEWQKTTDSIGQGLTDSLFRAFESGKDFFATFWDGIKNLFKTTVLKMMIQPVQGAISGMVGSVLGGIPGMSAAGTAGGIGETAGGLGNMLGMAGSLGTLGLVGQVTHAWRDRAAASRHAAC